MKTLFIGLVVLLICQLSLQQTCSASRPCEDGCCSKWGSCGFGPDFCGDGCLSGCNRKSECNPGWKGAGDKWSDYDKCPLNVCCSKFGYCGTTDEFCGKDDKVNRPSCGISDTPVNRVIGYYEAWSMTERSCYGMLPEDIPFGYYTHINFAFATIDPNTFQMIPGDHRTEDLMHRISSLKLLQPDLEVWVAVGGWTFSDPGPTYTTFSDIAASTKAQDAFIDSLIKLMNTFGFDGLDLDWEYPVDKDRGGKEADFKNFVTFMARLRKRLKSAGLKKGISLTLPSSYWYLQHFGIVDLEEYVDWFNIMSYDIHGSWDIDNEFTGPYVNSHTNLTEIQMALDLLWRNDIDPDKVVLGMSYYSRTFTLADPGCSDPGCIVSSGGNAGKCSGTTGVLLHPEIQDIIRQNKLSPTFYREAAYKAVSWGDQWASFDDAATWRLKANLARSQCISGVMVWAMSQDDKDGTNVKALTSAVGRKVMDYPDFVEKPPPALPSTEDLPKSCTWTGCNQECPSGYKMMMRDGGTKEIFGDHKRCESGGGMSKWCCPADQTLPVCSWRGHRNSGSCKPGCNSGEVEVGSLRLGCDSGYQSACCTTTTSTAAWGSCKWIGSKCAMNEVASCDDEYPYKVASAAWGQGGQQPCGYGSAKLSYCCKNPPPADFKKCSWVTDKENRKGKECTACRDDQINLAGRWTDACLTPGESLCCERPKLEVRDPDPEDEEDPFGSNQAKEFKGLIDKYKDNPTCPATVLEPPIHDRFHKRSRSLVLEAHEFDVLRGRATECTLGNWFKLLQFATIIVRNRSPNLEPLRLTWQDEIADEYDEEYGVNSLRSFFNLFPSFDPHSWLEYILLNPFTAGSGMRRARGAAESLCELPSTSSSTRRDIDDADSSIRNLVPRFIWAWGGGTNDVPGLATILEGIRLGDLTLHYARWVWSQEGNSNNAAGPLLELAYWIGTDPGVAQTDTHFNQYRDMTTRQGRADRWVVFHLHFNPRTQWLRRFQDGNGQRTYAGVHAVRIFHGQTARRYANAGWRVEGGDTTNDIANGGNNEGLNARDGFVCPQDLGSLWYVGRQVHIPGDASEEDQIWYERLQNWGETLLQEGYVGTPGLGIILPTAGQINGDIDPNNPGPLLMDFEASPSLGGGYAYGVSWRMDDSRHVDTFIPSPPNPWS